ncbi:hypothetical protein [Mucilaginibacter sp.]|jgi:hypothetical protein|uniref:hypothetical protein n=1 Tax=Mucilaginibacter sp. TaxID=1882438 RepID=UPI002ED12FB4
MTINDVSLIGKKVLVGVIVTLIPFIIIFGGLWLGRKLLEKGPATKTAQIVQPQKNSPS